MPNAEQPPHWKIQLLLLILTVSVLGLFFAHVEIQIEGPHGWATSLPTWRIEHHWLLDIFWGGRPMTGYHAWVFPFIALMFHFALLFRWEWSWRLEARIIACIMLFWISEDFLWFVFNPAYGLDRFDPQHIPWHIHWFWFAPTDYWVSLGSTVLLFWISFRPASPSTTK